MSRSNSQCAVFSFFALMLGVGITGCGGGGGGGGEGGINNVTVVADAGNTQYISTDSRVFLDASDSISLKKEVDEAG